MEVPLNSFSFSPDTTDAAVTTSTPRKSSSEMLDDSLSMEDENISFLPIEDKLQQPILPSTAVEDHLPCPSQETSAPSKPSSQQFNCSQSSTGSGKVWLSNKFSPVVNVNKICPTFGKKKQSKPSSISNISDRQSNDVTTPESSQNDDKSTKSSSIKSVENTAIETNIGGIVVDSLGEKKAKKKSASSSKKPSATVDGKVDKLKLKEQRANEREEKRLEKERCKQEKQLAIEKRKAEREQKKMEKDLKKIERQEKKNKKQSKVNPSDLNDKEDEHQQPDAENQPVMEGNDGTPESDNNDRDISVGPPKHNTQESDVNQIEQNDDKSQDDNTTETTITEQLPIHDNNNDSSEKESDREQTASNSDKENCDTVNKTSVDKSPSHNIGGSKTKQKKRKHFSPVRQKKSTKKAKVVCSPKPSHVWVQCDRPSCLKWRLLVDITDPTVLPRKWYCSMNKDSKYNSCSISEEEVSAVDDTVEFIYSPYNLGSLVWAKMEGYPWWPAMIDNDPDLDCYYEPSTSSVTPVRYHVVFFDKPVSRGWIHSMNLQPLTEDSKLSDFNEVPLKYQKPLSVAFDQAHGTLCLTAEERLKKVGFRALYRRSKKQRFDD